MIDAGKVEHIESFQTDLQILFNMLKCKNQKEELQKYVDEHADYFQELDVDTAQAYSVFLHSKKLLKKMLPENEKKEGKVNMCKALEDLYQDGINQGISQGISQGLEQGRLRINSLNQKLASQNRIDDIMKSAVSSEYQDKLLKEFGL